jgi:hypothetical protein
MLLVTYDDIGYNLWMRFIYCFPDTNPGIKPVIDLNRTNFHTVPTAGTIRCPDIPGMTEHMDREVPRFSLYFDNFRTGMKCYGGMPLNLDHLGT